MEFDGGEGGFEGQATTTFAASQDYTFDPAAQQLGDPFGAAEQAGAASFVAPPVDSFASVPAVPSKLEYAAPMDGGSNPLVEFNKKFRSLCDDKDAKERDAKAARRSAGKAALKKALGDRAAAVETRKASNREAEARKEKEAMDALEGEPWGRVVSLIDIHAHSKAAAEGEGGAAAPKKKPSADVAVPDVARHKDILISLKAAGGLPPATA